jgi:hypothetical protein
MKQHLQHVIVSLVLLLVPRSAVLAVPILIQEVSDMVGTSERASPPPSSVPFGITIYQELPNSTLTLLEWMDNYGPTDVGKTFVAPTSVVQQANLAIGAPNIKYFLETGPANFSPGRNFAIVGSYVVTSVERTIDQLVITPPPLGGELYSFQGQQTVRFWGVRIPEPITIVQVSLILCACCASRQSLYGRRRPKSHWCCRPTPEANL